MPKDKPSFWAKAKHITASVGKIALAGAGIAVAAVSGVIITGLGYTADVLVAAGPTLGLFITAGAVALGGLVLELAGANGALDVGLSIAGSIANLAMNFAIIEMIAGTNSRNHASIELGSSAWKGTKEAIEYNANTISTEMNKLRTGPRTRVSNRQDYLSQSPTTRSADRLRGIL